MVWHFELFGDCCSLVHTAISEIWQCLQILTLFILWKIRCKSVFENRVNSLSAFCCMWRYEVLHQLLAKAALLIKDGKSLDLLAYSDFI